MKLRNRLNRAINYFTDRPPIRYPSAQLEESVLVSDHKLLSGKNVLITGAGRNIGKSIAIEMAKQGANIFFTDIDEKRCRELEQALDNNHVKVKGLLSDISKTGDVDDICSFLEQNEIKIDILVNNVGIQYKTKKIKDFDLEEWHNIFNTNVFGPMYLTKLISQMMMDNYIQGSILFITSIHQWIIFRRPSYSASKAALGMVIKELALDLAPYGIRVNGVAPGWVTEDQEGTPLSPGRAPLRNSSINPRYIGRAIVYLASDYFSKFTTGTVITIDAGLSLRSRHH